MSCIDARFRLFGLEPQEQFRDSATPRRCVCIDCGYHEDVAYSKIRNGSVFHCKLCSCRKAYEHGLANNPDRWNITKFQAAEMVLGDEFIAKDEAGKIMKVKELATRMAEVWSLVSVTCIKCGVDRQWSASMSMSMSMSMFSAKFGLDQNRCFTCAAQSVSIEHDEVFAAFGLARAHRGYSRLGEKVDAHCTSCGTERRVSLTGLMRGIAPCLSCAGSVDPDASHYVYLMHFPALRCYKVGITNSEARLDRVAVHEAQGGVIVQIREVPNLEAAKTVEKYVLRLFMDSPSGCKPRDFPQGGYTETWGEEADLIDLDALVAHLHERRAPGFDRLDKLREVFKEKPPTIDELREFVRLKVEKCDGIEVHCLGMSKPLEQVLGQIQAIRKAKDALDAMTSGHSRYTSKRKIVQES